MTDRCVIHDTFSLERTYPVVAPLVFAAFASAEAKEVWENIGDRKPMEGRLRIDLPLLWRAVLPRRDPLSHKYKFGHAVVVGRPPSPRRRRPRARDSRVRRRRARSVRGRLTSRRRWTGAVGAHG